MGRVQRVILSFLAFEKVKLGRGQQGAAVERLHREILICYEVSDTRRR
jgi:hypothetical protein